MIRVADYIAERLNKVYGVDHVFMISGGGAMHLNDAFGTCEGIEYICNHHEQASAIGAEGYARVSGKLGVVNVTTGPGGTNAITGVFGQWTDSVPVLYISGQVKYETTIASCPEIGLRQLGDQEVDIVNIVKPITKYAKMITDSLEIKRELDKAIKIATTGRPGPVWLDIPLNIQGALIDEGKLYESEEDEGEKLETNIEEEIKEIVEKLKDAKSPLILVGQGVRISKATEKFNRLINRFRIPVVTSIGGSDLIDSSSELFFGRPGICGDRMGNIAVQNSDFLIILGSRMSIRLTSYNSLDFAKNAYKIFVNIDDKESEKRTIKIEKKLQIDAGKFIENFYKELGEQEYIPNNQWISWGNNLKTELPSLLEDNKMNPDKVSSYSFAKLLFKNLTNDSVIVTGNGTAYTSTYQAMNIKKGMRVIANQGCAAMGYDIPAAIGACIGNEKKETILITGDGSVQMNLQELQTILTYKLPIKIFVLENNGYLAIKTTQDSFFEGRHVASGPDSGVICPDICKIGEAYGFKTYRIKNENELNYKINEIIEFKGSCICEISMDSNQTLFPKVASIRLEDGTMISKPMEDMFPFLEEGLLEKCYFKKK